jgi:hypothetical protein
MKFLDCEVLGIEVRLIGENRGQLFEPWTAEVAVVLHEVSEKKIIARDSKVPAWYRERLS